MPCPALISVRTPHLLIACLFGLGLLTGCRTSPEPAQHAYREIPPLLESSSAAVTDKTIRSPRRPTATIRQTSFGSTDEPAAAAEEDAATDSSAAVSALNATDQPDAEASVDTGTSAGNETPGDTDTSAGIESLASLEATALAAHPRLISLQQQVQAAWAKTRHIDKLPDPTVGMNVFGHPIETAAGSQRANLSVMQMVPWLERLEAAQRQACFEALALQQMQYAEQLKIVGDVRTRYFRLYVLQKQLDSIAASQQLLQVLIDVANARVANAQATQGDVLLGTLELSRLEEERLTLQQQLTSTAAELNRLLNRPVDTSITPPQQLTVIRPQWSLQELITAARQHQPLIAAATLQAQATRWGIEVAELRRRPDVTLSAGWFAIDDNRPPSTIVDVGHDAWSLGASLTVPIGREKYDAVRDEARWKHAATNSDRENVVREFEATLLDLQQQAQAAAATADLYRDTIIPQARQTLRSDQAALSDGAVEFDRVIQDFRQLLTLEVGYHRTLGNLAIANARLSQATGTELPGTPLQSAFDDADSSRSQPASESELSARGLETASFQLP